MPARFNVGQQPGQELWQQQYRARLKGGPPGLVKFVAAVAYHFCQALPAAFKQPGNNLLAEPCTTFVLNAILTLLRYYNCTYYGELTNSRMTLAQLKWLKLAGSLAIYSRAVRSAIFRASLSSFSRQRERAWLLSLSAKWPQN